MKLLLKLWLTQLRRNFKWGKFFGEAYFAFLFITLSVVITLVVRKELGDAPGMEAVVPFIAVSIIVPDFINKLLMKHDETVMDHYLKSRPVSERSWNRFLLTTNLFNLWNWFIPVMLLPFCVLMLPWYAAVPAIVLLFSVSLVGGVAITSLRRARGWTNKWPVLVAMVVWLIVAFMYSLTSMLLPWGLQFVGFLLLCAGAIAVFYDYLCDLRRYDESRAKAGRLFLGASSLFSMEYVSVLRSKRLRVAVLIMPLIFVFNSYTQCINGLNVMFYMMLMFAIFSPSMMLGQWVFGIEGNYMDCLWTKPVSIRELLGNKLRFFALLNIVPTLLVVPLVWIADLSPWLLAATLVFTVGVANLSLMPTALISSRLELFQSAFFNYQGASMAINVYGLVVIVPIAVYCLCTWLMSAEVCAIVLTAAGIVGIALYRPVIGWLSRKYEQRRYVCFERYRQ